MPKKRDTNKTFADVSYDDDYPAPLPAKHKDLRFPVVASATGFGICPALPHLPANLLRVFLTYPKFEGPK